MHSFKLYNILISEEIEAKIVRNRIFGKGIVFTIGLRVMSALRLMHCPYDRVPLFG